MTSKETKAIEKIRAQYEMGEATQTELNKLTALDKQVKRPVQVFSYIFGTAGALTLGTGMSMAMGLIPGGMGFGVAIGCVGILLASTCYPIYKKLLSSRKKKFAPQIIEISNSILKEDK